MSAVKKIHLDRRIRVIGAYDAANSRTSFGKVPYTDSDPEAVFMLITETDKVSLEWSLVDIGGGVFHIVVADASGIYDGVAAYYGKKYEMRFRFSEWGIKAPNDNVTNLQGRLQTRTLVLNYVDTGDYEIQYTPKGRAKRTRKMPGTPPMGSAPISRSGIDRVFLMSGAEGLVVDIVNDTYLPTQIVTAAWEGWYTTRNQVL